MSAAEVIERIKALPPAEADLVRAFLLNGATDNRQPADVKFMSDDEFKQTAARVFEEHDELLRKLAQ